MFKVLHESYTMSMVYCAGDFIGSGLTDKVKNSKQVGHQKKQL